ncbi:MAG TPA: HD domain-containing phosphohydrolase, partial [Azospira sp.]|nr:HD domain-containing phosphohydrolase [Azospira sp.]
ERWDGQGYPQGLAGEGIPFAARLMAVADVYDALISRRPYKTAKSHEESAAIIVGLSGQHLDPVVVAAFEKHGERFRAIARGFQDVN